MGLARDSVVVWHSLTNGWSLLSFSYYGTRETSVKIVTWAPVLKRKCIFNLNVIWESKDWQEILRGNAVPSCLLFNSSNMGGFKQPWQDFHLVRKGTKSMPASVVSYREAHRYVSLNFFVVVEDLKIRTRLSCWKGGGRKTTAQHAFFFSWLLEVFILRGLKLLERCPRINISTGRCGLSASYFTATGIPTSGCRWMHLLG